MDFKRRVTMQFSSLNLPNGLQIRPSMASDKIFLEQLYISSRNDLDYIQGEKDFIEELKQKQYEAQVAGYGDSFPNAMYFVIEYHSERIGRAVLDFGHNEIRLVDIIIMPKAQGKGLGQAIIRSFMHCADQVRSPLTLSVLSENVQAKALYLKLGFVVDEVHPPHELMTYYPQIDVIRHHQL